jgi:hypothetical protein
MHQPVTLTDAIALINSMFATSNLSQKNNDSACLGKKYWQNFKKRHPKINKKKAVCFDVN